MKRILGLVFAALVCFGCGDGRGDDKDELGKLSLAVTTSTATHVYRLQGTIQLWQSGTHLQDVPISADAPAVILGDLEPGNYDVFLSGPSLLKDGSPVSYTMVSANPHPVTVTAGATTVDNWAFSVAGDPVEFECTPETCGALSFTVSVAEVPPS